MQGEGRAALRPFADGFGNLLCCHTVNRLHESSIIAVEGEVETRDTGGVVHGIDEMLPPMFFLRVTPLAEANSAIEDLARDGPHDAKPLDRMIALMERVRDRVDYRTSVTDTMTTAAQALASGAGVCQDHAHLFIAAARVLNVPARYVGGYLWTGKDDAEYEASHA